MRCYAMSDNSSILAARDVEFQLAGENLDSQGVLMLVVPSIDWFECGYLPTGYAFTPDSR